LDTNLIFFLENPSRLAKKNKNQFYRQTVHVENTGTSESIFICLFFGHPSIRIFHALQQMQSFFPLISEGRGAAALGELEIPHDRAAEPEPAIFGGAGAGAGD